MLTYLIFKEVIYDIFILDFILDGDSLDKAIGIWEILFFGIVGIIAVIVDLMGIPIYLLICITALIFKLIELMRR